MFGKSLRPLGVALLMIFLASGPLMSILQNVNAEEEEEAPWVISHQVQGNLAVTPDSSLSQWSEAHHGHVDSLDGVETELLSVHNDTYIVFLFQRSFNLSITMAGVAIFFNGTVFGGEDAVWGWAGGQNGSTDSGVSSAGDLNADELTVVLGRPLVPSVNSKPRLEIGQLYDQSVRATSWNNDTMPTTLNVEELGVMGLELLPPIDLFPKAPLIYSAVILVATLGFVLLEARRYRH